jgi:hypothetical protein
METIPEQPVEDQNIILIRIKANARYLRRYHKRMVEPEYRAKMCARASAAYQRKREADIAAGAIPRTKGRPRKTDPLSI